jgi:regulator of RNase E activity RraA
VPDDVVAAYRQVSTIAIADALDSVFHLPGIISNLNPLVDGSRFVGRALTVRFVPTGAFEDYHKLTSTEAMSKSQAGDVIVLAAGAFSQAVWGDQQAAEASKRGFSGAVVDGYIRDVAYLKRLGLPVFAKGRSPAPVRGHGRREAVNVPVSVCGMLVEPGDIVAADEDGIVVVAAARAAEVLKVAQEIHESEVLVAKDVAEGRDLLESRQARLPEYLRPWYLR